MHGFIEYRSASTRFIGATLDTDNELYRNGRTASARNPAPARSTRAVLEVKKFCSSEDAADPPDLSRLDIPIPDWTVLIFFLVLLVPFFFGGGTIEVNVCHLL